MMRTVEHVEQLLAHARLGHQTFVNEEMTFINPYRASTIHVKFSAIVGGLAEILALLSDRPS